MSNKHNILPQSHVIKESSISGLSSLLTSRRRWLKEIRGPITWRISAQAEISAWLLKQILLKSNCQLHGEGFSRGLNSVQAGNPSPVCSNCARIFSPGKWARKSEKNLNHVIKTEFQPGLKSRKQYGCR